MINGNACFAYFNKIWGIPKCSVEGLQKVFVLNGVTKMFGSVSNWK